MDDKYTGTFKLFNLKEDILRGVIAYGFEYPSEIQMKTIPLIIEHKDVIAQAKSGMGKTGAFCIGMLQNIDTNLERLQGIIIVNTHELANQVYNVMHELGRYDKRLCVSLSIGGISLRNNIDELRQTHITIGTIGRLYDLLVVKNNIVDLDEVRMMVIDEVDTLLNKRTGDVNKIKGIVEKLPRECQMCIFSATIPDSIVDIANKFMIEPVKILVKNEDLTLEGIKQYYINMDNERMKIDVLFDIYKIIMISQCIIYVNTIDKAMFIYEKLKENNYSISCIHGGMEPKDRLKIMRQFRLGENRILISTDLLARGIDVQQVNLIINYDIPCVYDNYLHRIGRSGRFGRKGVSISFVTPNDIRSLKEIMKKYNTLIEEMPEDISDQFS